MSQCRASLVLCDPKDGVWKNWPCQGESDHLSAHVTVYGTRFSDNEDWRNVEREMFHAKTDLYARKNGFLKP